MMLRSFLVTYTITLFALVNALGMVPVFIGYTAGEKRRVNMWVALFVSATACALMLIVLVAGKPILDFLSVTLDAFRIAGGIVLLLIGVSMINGRLAETTQETTRLAELSDLAAAQSVYGRVVVPMAMPLLVGPGVIAYIILHASEVEAAGQDVRVFDMAIGIAVVSILCFVTLAGGRAIERVAGRVALSILTRIMGLLVTAIGVQFVENGSTQFFIHSILPELQKLP